jgi:hypothetical protein
VSPMCPEYGVTYLSGRTHNNNNKHNTTHNKLVNQRRRPRRFVNNRDQFVSDAHATARRTEASNTWVYTLSVVSTFTCWGSPKTYRVVSNSS